VKEIGEVARGASNMPGPAVIEEVTTPAVFIKETMTTRQAAMTAVAILIFVFFSVEANNFLSVSNVLDIGRATAFIGIVAVAWTYLLIAGELDLSVGSIYGLGTILLGWLIAGIGLDPWFAAGLILAYGIVIGLINGIVTVYIGVRAFVVTLGMLSLLRGAALAMSGNFPISYPRDLQSTFFAVGGGSPWGIPVQVIWFAAVAIIGGVVLARTKFGFWVYATGGNETAAREMGIPTSRMRLIAFVLVGFSCGLIAVLQGAWLKSASPSTGIGFELQVIGAVLIGGASLNGGDGNIWGTVVGAVILGMVTNGLVLFGFPPASGLLASGGIVMIAGVIDVLLRRASGRLAGQVSRPPAS
jgi:ribose/xylose/arabinose/galactoside ABC-type transport system permease subunit